MEYKIIKASPVPKLADHPLNAVLEKLEVGEAVVEVKGLPVNFVANLSKLSKKTGKKFVSRRQPDESLTFYRIK